MIMKASPLNKNKMLKSEKKFLIQITRNSKIKQIILGLEELLRTESVGSRTMQTLTMF